MTQQTRQRHSQPTTTPWASVWRAAQTTVAAPLKFIGAIGEAIDRSQPTATGPRHGAGGSSRSRSRADKPQTRLYAADYDDLPEMPRALVPVIKGMLVRYIGVMKSLSPIATLAFLDVLSLIKGDHHADARTRLGAAFRQNIPTDTSMDIARANLRTANQSGKPGDIATAKTGLYEERWLALFFGDREATPAQLRALITDLDELIADLVQHHSSVRRVFSLRMMKASMLLRLARSQPAIEELSTCVGLWEQIAAGVDEGVDEGSQHQSAPAGSSS